MHFHSPYIVFFLVVSVFDFCFCTNILVLNPLTKSQHLKSSRKRVLKTDSQKENLEKKIVHQSYETLIADSRSSSQFQPGINKKRKKLFDKGVLCTQSHSDKKAKSIAEKTNLNSISNIQPCAKQIRSEAHPPCPIRARIFLEHCIDKSLPLAYAGTQFVYEIESRISDKLVQIRLINCYSYEDEVRTLANIDLLFYADNSDRKKVESMPLEPCTMELNGIDYSKLLPLVELEPTSKVGFRPHSSWKEKNVLRYPRWHGARYLLLNAKGEWFHVAVLHSTFKPAEQLDGKYWDKVTLSLTLGNYLEIGLLPKALFKPLKQQVLERVNDVGPVNCHLPLISLHHCPTQLAPYQHSVENVQKNVIKTEQASSTENQDERTCYEPLTNPSFDDYHAIRFGPLLVGCSYWLERSSFINGWALVSNANAGFFPGEGLDRTKPLWFNVPKTCFRDQGSIKYIPHLQKPDYVKKYPKEHLGPATDGFKYYIAYDRDTGMVMTLEDALHMQDAQSLPSQINPQTLPPWPQTYAECLHEVKRVSQNDKLKSIFPEKWSCKTVGFTSSIDKGAHGQIFACSSHKEEEKSDSLQCKGMLKKCISLRSEFVARCALAEIKALRMITEKLDHLPPSSQHSFPTLYGAELTKDMVLTLYIERLSGRPLDNLYENKSLFKTVKQLRVLARSLIDTLEYLHNELGIVHRDLHMRNILWDDVNQKVRLIDLGGCSFLKLKEKNSSLPLSPTCCLEPTRPSTSTWSWATALFIVPPEVYEHKDNSLNRIRQTLCSPDIDIFAVGVCLLSCATGESFKTELGQSVVRFDHNQTKDKDKKDWPETQVELHPLLNQYLFKLVKGENVELEQAASFIANCLAAKGRRATLTQLKQHPFLRK